MGPPPDLALKLLALAIRRGLEASLTARRYNEVQIQTEVRGRKTVRRFITLFLLLATLILLEAGFSEAARRAPSGVGGFPVTPMHAAAWFGEQSTAAGKTLALMVFFEGTPGWQDTVKDFSWTINSNPATIHMKVVGIPVLVEYWPATSTVVIFKQKFNLDLDNVFLVRNITNHSPSVIGLGHYNLHFSSDDNPAVVLLQRAAGIRGALIGEPEESSAENRSLPKASTKVVALDTRGLELMHKNNPEDDHMACDLFRQAAESGYAKSQYRLGYCYQTGRGVKQDLVKANEWYLKAAKQGYVHAQYKLAYSYRVGRGMEVDLVKAMQWYMKAAEQGDTEAQYYVGMMYATGQGTGRDVEKACWWYQKAANQGLAAAQYELAVRYRDGNGVQKDLVESYKWLLILESQRRSLPASDWQQLVPVYKGVESQITEAQRTKARGLARDWLKDYTRQYLTSLAE